MRQDLSEGELTRLKKISDIEFYGKAEQDNGNHHR